MRAIHFFTFLNESYKLHSERVLEWSQIISLPHMKREDARRFTEMYRAKLMSVEDLTGDNHDYSNIDKLRGLL